MRLEWSWDADPSCGDSRWRGFPQYFAASSGALREARALRRSRILEAKRSRTIAWDHMVVPTQANRHAGP